MESKKIEMPKNMATALDCAIREFEVKDGNCEYGYQIPDKPIYDNYMSNKRWELFLEEMPDEYKRQFNNGSGGELKEKNGRTPPKMASYGSSSRFIYELSKGIVGFNFEVLLDTRVGGIANLDGFLHNGSEYIYVEAKRREIYYGTHKNNTIKSVYIPVYDKIKNTCGSV